MDIEVLLDKFEEPTQLSDGSFQVKCPSHNDEQASLNITESKGKILLKCYAGCTVGDIVQSLGLKVSDMFQDKQKDPEYFTYFSADGQPVYRVVKSPGKKFHLQHFDEEWKSGLGGRKRILYRLPDLLDQDTKGDVVFWVEGEKDANRLDNLGLLSTTTSTGAATKLEGIDLSPLHSREVIIIPDNDEPGKKYADKVKKALAGIASRVRIIELPGLAEKEDISNWLDKGHSIDELWELKAKSSYGDIIHVSEIIEDIRKDVQTRKSGKELLRGIPTGLLPLDEKLAANGVPCGKVTIFAGATSSGKSALANTVILSALQHNHKVLCIALEDEPKCVTTRMLSSLSNIQNRQLQQARIFPDQEAQFEEAVAQIVDTSLYFKEDTLSVIDLADEIQAFTADNGIDLVVIDFLQLIPPGQRFGKKQEEVDYIFGVLVAMARKLKDTATLVVSQLRRNGDDIPTKESLYHSGALEQWAHTIGLLYRPKIDGFEDCCLFILDKQKNGPTGDIVLGWHADTVSYNNIDPKREALYRSELAKL